MVIKSKITEEALLSGHGEMCKQMMAVSIYADAIRPDKINDKEAAEIAKKMKQCADILRGVNYSFEKVAERLRFEDAEVEERLRVGL